MISRTLIAAALTLHAQTASASPITIPIAPEVNAAPLQYVCLKLRLDLYDPRNGQYATSLDVPQICAWVSSVQACNSMAGEAAVTAMDMNYPTYPKQFVRYAHKCTAGTSI